MEEVIVTDHAIQRFREWTGSKKGDKEVAEKIQNLLGKAEPLEARPDWLVTRMIKTGFKEIEPYYFRGFLFIVVIDDGKRKVVTLYITKLNKGKFRLEKG